MLPIVEGSEWFVAKPILEKSVEWQVGMISFMAMLALAAVIYSAIQVRRSGRWHPFFIVIGAALAAFYEPLGDLFAHVSYHEANQINFTSAFGFQVPIWLLPAYIVFFGWPIVWLGTLIDKGISLQKWMLLFFAMIPGAWIFEVPMIAMRCIEYYGANQPFKIFDYPVWMAFVNTSTTVAGAGLVALMIKAPLVERQPILLVALVPMVITGSHASASLPLASAINSSAGPVAVNSMALLSMAAATLLTFFVGTLVCRGRAGESDSRLL